MELWKKRYIITPDITLNKGDKGDPGPPGADGASALPLSSDDVDYRGSVLTDILDDLLYLALDITSFYTLTYNYEKGVTLNSIQLYWAYNKAVESQTITGTGVTPPTLAVGDRGALVTLSSITISTLITLTADDVIADGNSPKTATVDIQFLNKIYYGKRTLGTINSAFILALPTGELKGDRYKSFVADTDAGEYIFFACPTAYGVPSFKTNGFDGGIDYISTISFTNASGHTEDYDVYRSTNEDLGVTTVDVL